MITFEAVLHSLPGPLWSALNGFTDHGRVFLWQRPGAPAGSLLRAAAELCLAGYRVQVDHDASGATVYARK